MREFSMFAIRLGSVLGALAWAGAAPGREAGPDLILHGGRIYTVNERGAVAEALAIAGDRILAVGSDKEILALGGPGTRKIDLDGRAVFPGFIDAHAHLASLAASLDKVSLVGTPSYEAVVAKVAERAKTTPAGEWITGFGWDQNDWPEKTFPRHEALSRAVPEHPVWLTRIDGHAGLANAKAMALAKNTAAAPDRAGGKIHRDPQTGAPTGVFVDNAMGAVARRIPPRSTARQHAAIQRAIQVCLRHGLTGIHDAGVNSDHLKLYRKFIDENRFDLRVYAMISASDKKTLERYFNQGPSIGYGGQRLTVRSVKIGLDGALGSRGAALLEPYADDAPNRGILTGAPDEMRDVVKRALAAGFQVCCHAIGDRANRLTLDIYEEALKAAPEARDPRLRIEHAQIVALADIPRFAKLGVIPSMQATHATSDMPWAEARVGPERIKGAYAWRRFIETGCRIANGSDFPVEDVNPLWGFYSAITRQDHQGQPAGGWFPRQRMTRAEALRSFTIDAAYASFEEDIKGSLAPGKLADLVVLSRDIMTIEPAAILKTDVDLTLLGGRIVYRRKVRVRMAAYNVACGQWTTPEKVARELKRHELDILGLNEMPRLIEGKTGEEWCARLAQALELPYVYSGAISSANHGAPKWVDESGNYEGKYKAVLSRTPLFNTREFELTGGNWNPASAVRAVTVVGGVRFAFYSLHVNTHWRDLEKVFQEDREFHVFGGGDYNHSNYPAFDKAANMRDGRWEVAGKKSLDRIFYRPNGKVKCAFNDVIRPDPKMSDHPYAVSVFEFDADQPVKHPSVK